jgi:hypothetical protein
MQLRLFTLYDFINALLQPYHDVLLRYDPLAGISSSGLLIATRIFFETCGSIWGAIPPENSLEADDGVERIGEKTSPAANGAAIAPQVPLLRQAGDFGPQKSVKTLWVLHNVVVS